MDRNEQNLKIEEFKTAMHNRDFEKAVDIADSLDLKKIKDNNFLSLVADAYEISHKYPEAKKVLLIAYENTNAGRQLAYRLCLIAVKTKEFDEAREFYEDFVEMAPRDSSKYILKYKMSKAQNAPIEKLIKILEEYVNIDMEERWAYELAKLYHLAGNKEKCINMCDEISLWFSEGKYVAKAMELKGMHKPGTVVPKTVEETEIQEIEEADFSDINIPATSEDKFNTMDIQAVIADGMKEVVFDENTNVHEGQQATKIAPDFKKTEQVEVEEVVEPKEAAAEVELEEIVLEDELEEIVNEDLEEKVNEDESEEITPEVQQKESAPEIEPIKDIKGVEDILRQLQARGILKAETVEQAVNIIDEAGKSSASDTQNVSTLERWEEDSVEPAEEVDEPVASEPVEAVNEPVEEDIKENVETEPEEVVAEEPEVAVHTAEIKLEAEPVVNGVPVFDLEFDAPQRDTSNDIGQKGIYENTVANSDLGNITDNLPSKEEIEEAIKKAEQTMEADAPELVNAGEDTTEFRSDKKLSVNVEILSGTDWQQDEATRKADNSTVSDKIEEKKEESTVDKTITQNVNIEVRPNIANVDLGVAKEVVQALTEEELSTFKNYLNVEGFATNIREVLQELIVNYTPNGKSTDGNVIIMGNEKTGKTTLAIETIKLVNKKRGRRGRKLAKIDAAALNRRGFRNSINKLLGSDLIIENAHNLGAMTLSEVIDASGMFTDDMLIILEGETEQMEKMLEESPRLSDVFNHVISIREYDIKEWVEYGKKYAVKQGYTMDEMANLAFFKAIDDFFGTNKGIGQNDVETIVNDAIDRSRRIGRKLSGIFSSKKDEDGLYTLVESDFNVK